MQRGSWQKLEGVLPIMGRQPVLGRQHTLSTPTSACLSAGCWHASMLLPFHIGPQCPQKRVTDNASQGRSQTQRDTHTPNHTHTHKHTEKGERGLGEGSSCMGNGAGLSWGVLRPLIAHDYDSCQSRRRRNLNLRRTKKVLEWLAFKKKCQVV
jgi:hypothetical protein